MTFPVVRERFAPSYRIVASRFPPVDLFERIADPQDLEAVYAIQALTNPRLRQEVGELSLVPPEDRVSGPGTSPIMAAFTHLNPNGSRFSDGSYGVYYAAREQETAIYETVYHAERFLRDSREAPIEQDMRVYIAPIEGDFHDLRGEDPQTSSLYHKSNYGHAQALGARLRAARSWGVVYHSVRHSGGECVAVFRPPVISPCTQGAHLTYIWDGQRIAEVYEKREVPIKLP